MKLRKAIVAVALCVMLLVPALTAIAFDITGQMPESSIEYLDVSDIITRCTVLGTAEGFLPVWDNNELRAIRAVGVFGQEGSCFYVGSHGNRHLFVTNAHVVKPAAVQIQESKNIFYVTEPIKIISIVITVGQGTGLGSAPAEVIYCNEEQDIAIVAIIGNWEVLKICPAPYTPVWTWYNKESLIHEGDQIATIVATRPDIDAGELAKGVWFEVRYGKVLHEHPWLPEHSAVPHWVVAWFQLGDVATDLKIYPGDSGSPIFAFRNGKPVIIGVARAAAYWPMPNGEYMFVSYFTRIDSIMQFVLEK